jgi:hypothetical protein
MVVLFANKLQLCNSLFLNQLTYFLYAALSVGLPIRIKIDTCPKFLKLFIGIETLLNELIFQLVQKLCWCCASTDFPSRLGLLWDD